MVANGMERAQISFDAESRCREVHWQLTSNERGAWESCFPVVTVDSESSADPHACMHAWSCGRGRELYVRRKLALKSRRLNFKPSNLRSSSCLRTNERKKKNRSELSIDILHREIRTRRRGRATGWRDRTMREKDEGLMRSENTVCMVRTTTG